MLDIDGGAGDCSAPFLDSLSSPVVVCRFFRGCPPLTARLDAATEAERQSDLKEGQPGTNPYSAEAIRRGGSW